MLTGKRKSPFGLNGNYSMNRIERCCIRFLHGSCMLDDMYVCKYDDLQFWYELGKHVVLRERKCGLRHVLEQALPLGVDILPSFYYLENCCRHPYSFRHSYCHQRIVHSFHLFDRIDLETYLFLLSTIRYEKTRM